MRLTITKGSFLDFYFNYGQDAELKEIRFDLADDIIKILYDKDSATISIQSIFDQCNKDCIRGFYCEELTDNIEQEIGDIFSNYEIELI
tara:strand:- start:246 stop:512 length:267 start_codon:yes stop_codon:yes gene_type:complete